MTHAAYMEKREFRKEKHAIPGFPDTETEVGILEVEKEPLVEALKFPKELRPREKRRPAHESRSHRFPGLPERLPGWNTHIVLNIVTGKQIGRAHV